VYERARPGYPAEIVAWMAERLDLRSGRTVLDLGAGTGKLTRALVATGAEVIALEPGDEMRRQLEQAVPEATAIAAGAESIPLPDASVDAATAGQSFHWFRLDEAVPEIRRVLRPGAGLALAWNMRDQEDALQREISALIDPLVPPERRGHITNVGRYFRQTAFEGTCGFGEFEERKATFSEQLDADTLVDRILSISFVASAPVDEQRKLERELRRLAGDRGGIVDFRYVTDAFLVRAV
jgi:SAM-dependent methyltransferase